MEDEFHGEIVGVLRSRAEALVLVERLRDEPEAEENQPPCTSWRTCRREYYLLEYEDMTNPPLRRDGMFAIDFASAEVTPIPRD